MNGREQLFELLKEHMEGYVGGLILRSLGDRRSTVS